MPTADLRAWSEKLAEAAISEVDHRAIEASETARALVLDRLHDGDRDSLHAWAGLGRVLAGANASPSLASSVVDALDAALERRAIARAALFESYVAAQRELADARVAEAWRFPRCVVRLDAHTAAVAASFPDEDADATARWADEIAAGLAKMGIRSVHAQGAARARAALADALSTFDIALVATKA